MAPVSPMPTAFRAGSFECRLIVDGDGVLPPEAVFENVPAADRAAALGDRLGPRGLEISYGCLLLRRDDLVVLVDTGMGGYEHPYGGSGGALDSRLADAGVGRADVGIVVISHSHVDHIGGLCIDGRPRFPDARHVISRVEWDSVAEEPDSTDREQLFPLEEAGVLELVDGAADLVADVRLIEAPGHTAGHLAVEIGPAGGALYLADTIIDELHIAHPEWTPAFDDDAERNIETRTELLGRAVDERRTVAAAHIPGAGRIERAAGGFRFETSTSEP
jgi:glyoxylase-like metal-dependent hydrolase (beta-lactamase superfamily II)